MAPQQSIDPQMAAFLEEEKRKAMFNEVCRPSPPSISPSISLRLGFAKPWYPPPLG
jgi:hypothetical protein